MRAIAKLWRPKLFIPALAVAGLFSGAALNSQTQVVNTCEQDECNWGFFVDDCGDNNGVNTGCSSQDWNSCKTYICGQSTN